MQTLLFIIGLLVLGLITLIFLIIFLKGMQSLNGSYGLEEEFENDNNIELDSFKSGLNQGIFIGHMGLYKLWVDGGESMVIGTYDNLQELIDKNIVQFYSDKNILEEWNTKYLNYSNSKKEDPLK